MYNMGASGRRVRWCLKRRRVPTRVEGKSHSSHFPSMRTEGEWLDRRSPSTTSHDQRPSSGGASSLTLSYL